ncbi:MAG: DUF5668 domain-containing protein [Dehalococcoidales bacterium]|nr:DUF5668 domain-containing protein [Dehalococcoidales bacterium]
MGIIALLIKLDVISGSVWGYAWPVILIIAGLVFVFGCRHKHGWCGCWPHDEEKQ